MSTWPQIGVNGDATVMPQGADDLLDGVAPNIWVTSQDGSSKFYIDGALAPWPGIQDGMVMRGGWKGLEPNFKHVDLKSARQPGVNYTGTVFDVLEIELPLQAHANSAQGISKMVSEWVSMWKPTKLCTFEYWTPDRGYWWFPARRSKPWPDAIQKHPRLLLAQNFTQTIRCDSGFWFGMPSISQFPPKDAPLVGGSGSGFLPLTNIGTEDAWPTILFYGPGTFRFAAGPGLSTMITFGPLAAGQIVLMRTLPRLRVLTDLTNAPSQVLTPPQQLLSQIINFVTNNNVPPLLAWFESQFGILPQQGPLPSLLSGRYTVAFPGVEQPNRAQQQYLAVSISGGNADSKIVARIDPQRGWPE